MTITSKEELIQYWKEHSNSKLDNKVYGTDFYGFSEEIIKHIQKYENPESSFTLHELGCNLGRNLSEIKKNFPNATLSGNDVNEYALENHFDDLDIFYYDTAEFLVSEDKVFDYIITSAHLVHVHNREDEILKKYIPMKFRKKLIIIEQNRQDEKKGIKFPRNYDDFFNGSLNVIDKYDKFSISYNLLVYEHAK